MIVTGPGDGIMGLIARRRRFFVQRRFQGRFIAIFGLLTLAAAAAAALATSIAVDRALSEAMFRAHISERSTGEIVLPALLKTNARVTAATILGGIVAAALVFRRSATHLDDLCFRLATWEWQIAGGAAGDRPLTCPNNPRRWTSELDRALLTADESMRARYRPLADRADHLASAAGRLTAALGEARGADHVGAELERIGRDIEALGDELSQFQG